MRNGATLITKAPVPPRTIALFNGTTVLVDAGGTLIIDGNLNNNIAGAGSFTVEGTVYIYGDYTSNGNVDMVGNGQFFMTGMIVTSGGSVKSLNPQYDLNSNHY